MELHPVIHITSLYDTLVAAQLCCTHGVRSVFLIDHHHGDDDVVFAHVEALRAESLGLDIGVNLLGHRSPASAMVRVADAVRDGQLSSPIWALWHDDARGGEPDTATAITARDTAAGRDELADTLYFGGVAFKYTASYTDDPEDARYEMDCLTPLVQIPTTSGAGTNQSADVTKVAAMREGHTDTRFALASGVSAENVELYAPYITDIICASSVETEPYSGVFDPTRFAQLARTVNELEVTR